MSIIIGIDHGYYAIKTAHCSLPGWAYQLRRTRTLHPPRTLRVWRVLFCLRLRKAAYPAG